MPKHKQSDTPGLITLTTDFGLSDGYVASMKGVILSKLPTARIVAINHLIEPQNVLQAGIVLASAVKYFPPETIHVVVVDPGVGTDRSILAVEANRQIFLAPDNGVLSLILERYEVTQVRTVENRELFLSDISATFHGRDIFSPVAAHLAGGIPLAEVGPVYDQFIKGLFPLPVRQKNCLQGQIVYCDHFGNLMTNISEKELSIFVDVLDRVEVRIVERTIEGLARTYAEKPKGELLALTGSAGYVEIAVRDGSAATELKAVTGTAVQIKIP